MVGVTMNVPQHRITEQDLDAQATFVYNNVEVKKTGRIAKNQAATTASHHHILFEITPVDKENGDWTAWARQGDLYKIFDTTKEQSNDE